MRAVVRATRTFFSLALPYFRSEDRWIAGVLLTGILVVELGLVAILVAVNEWNKRFFNALENRDWSAAQFELIVFCFIALAAVAAGMMQFFLGQRLIIRWRRWITERYVSMWMANGRHYRLRLVDTSVDNIHLRIAGDVLIFLTRTHELFTSLIVSGVAADRNQRMVTNEKMVTTLPISEVNSSWVRVRKISTSLAIRKWMLSTFGSTSRTR